MSREGIKYFEMISGKENIKFFDKLFETTKTQVTTDERDLLIKYLSKFYPELDSTETISKVGRFISKNPEITTPKNIIILENSLSKFEKIEFQKGIDERMKKYFHTLLVNGYDLLNKVRMFGVDSLLYYKCRKCQKLLEYTKIYKCEKKECRGKKDKKFCDKCFQKHLQTQHEEQSMFLTLFFGFLIFVIFLIMNYVFKELKSNIKK
jgi:hypothetical protein